MEWIKVKDKLPSNYDVVLVRNDNGFALVCEHADGVFRNQINEKEFKYPIEWAHIETKSTLPRRASIDWFSKQMELKLRKNDHKGGWQRMDIKTLFHLLKEEIIELQEAIQDNSNIIDECTDVANFSMMIADISKQNS